MLTRSQAVTPTVETTMAAGPATFSKHLKRFAPGVTPAALVSGDGCEVVDVDGNVYIDTIGALGAVLLGYKNCAVDAAVHRQIDRGVAFSLMHECEVQVAERLCGMLPWVDQVRFSLNGADACNSAIKIARAATGKDHVLFCGFHGGTDSYMSTTGMDAGLLPCLKEFNHQYRWGEWDTVRGDLEAYHQQGRGGVAALMLEVPPPPWTAPPAELFQQLHEVWHWCRKYETLFILDEVVTGIRYGLQGAAGAYGVWPDLVCLGKALANGYPLSVVGGPRLLMDTIAARGVFASTTHGGNALGLAAAAATLDEVQQTPALQRLHAAGFRLGTELHGLFAAMNLPARVLGTPSRLILQWHAVPGVATAQQLKTLWMHTNIQQGVLHGGPLFPTAAMTEEHCQRIMTAAWYAAAVITERLNSHTIEDALPYGAVESDVFAQRYR